PGAKRSACSGVPRMRHSEGLGVLDNRNSVLAFGPFRLFPAERRLEREGSPIGAKIMLDSARIGTILGADANHGICPGGPVFRPVEPASGWPRPRSLGAG